MALTEAISDEEIIEFCIAASPRDIISEYPLGNKVCRLPNQQVVKRGAAVTETEAENQRRAFELLDPSIVRVPKVDRFFEHEGAGYLIMEFIEGRVIEELDETQYEKLATILSYFYSIPGSIAGNLCGHGKLYYCPFPDEGVAPMNMPEMEKWFNSRLTKNSPYHVSLQNCELVFTHRDLAPRNLVWQDDGSVCLLDWSNAGFFPPSIEVCCQLGGRDPVFNRRVEAILRSISKVDIHQVEAILEVWSNGFRYHL